MATTVRPSGLRIVAADAATVADAEPGTANAVTPEAVSRVLSELLDLVDVVSIDSSVAHVVELRVGPPSADHPLVLIEQHGGFTWATSSMADVFIFELSLTAGPANVTVFNRLPLPDSVYSGPVHIWSSQLDEWSELGATEPIGMPDRRAPRVLLLLHGLAGTTVSDFGLLAAPPWGQNLLESASIRYDAVVGFDHDTTDSASQNAAELRELLSTWTNRHGLTIDVIGLGRGAAVLNELTASLARDDDAGFSISTVIVIEEAGGQDQQRSLDLRTTSLFAGGRTVERAMASDELALTMVSKGFGTIARSVGVDSADRSPDYLADEALETHFVPATADPEDPAMLQRQTAYALADWLSLEMTQDVPRMAGPDSSSGSEDRDTEDRDTADRDTADRDTADRDTADRDTADRDTADRDTADRDTVMRGDRDTSDGESHKYPGRVVQAVVIHDGIERQTFVAGQANTLRCWIGPPPDPTDRVGAADQPVPELGVRVDVTVELSVDFEVVDRQPLSVPSSPTSRSGDCDLAVTVGAGELFLSAELAFTIDGRLYEFVQLQGRVLAGDETEAEGERLKLKSRVQRRDVIALTDRTTSTSSLIVDDDQDSPFLRTFGSLGSGSYEISDNETLVEFLADTLFVTTKRLIRQREKQAKEDDTTYVPFTDVDDEDWTDLLRTSAKHGWMLHRNLLSQGFDDPGDRIEVINLQPDQYLPIEFVYDRGAPADDAKVRAECVAAMAAGKVDCGQCHPFAALTDDERDANPFICPYGFWSLRKVIERHDVGPDGLVSSEAPSDEAHTIDELGSVLCGWSAKIREQDVDALQAQMATHTRDVTFASNWAEWKEQLSSNPGLLVALPHHEKGDDQLGSLEMGGDELGLERALDLYVKTESGGPGPILILLGCETDDSDSLGHPSFARAFHGMGAPVVVGTLSKVVGRHAAPFASKLVGELIAGHNDGTDIGQVMLDVRRKMFADGYLMALGVVALGDGDWKVRTRKDVA